ncbi:MAG: tetratricopeptide repeat protein [Alphaproteobacteria bacterium]
MTVGKFVPQDWSAPTAKPGMPARRRRGSFGLCLAMAVWTTVMPVDGAVGQTRNDGASGSGNDAAAYEVCIGLANTQPRRALIEAEGWAKQGGGAPARHCWALALFAQGRYEEAGTMLETLAAELERGNPASRRLGREASAQTGHAWLLAGQPSKAADAFSRALASSPDDVELLIDRAMALIAAERPFDAIDDLNRANDLHPERTDVLALRSGAYRRVGTLDLAQDDAKRALALDPDNPEALLESGIILRAFGKEAEARAAWQKILKVAPDSAAAGAARANLAGPPGRR